MSFFGRRTVLADLRLHKEQAGGVTAGTLNKQGGGTVAYTNVCLWPSLANTALGRGGFPSGNGPLTAWRVGEATAPLPDDTWTVAGVTVQVVSVDKRHFADESAGYCIYDCTVSKVL